MPPVRLIPLLGLSLLTACAQPSTPSPTATSPARPVVFAAASLSTVFPTIAPAQYSFDGSSGLVDQLKGGARADVFASADKKNMDKAVEAARHEIGKSRKPGTALAGIHRQKDLPHANAPSWPGLWPAAPA